MSMILVWMVIGIGLIIFELLITSVVAVFFGIGAIVTAILLQFGLIESSASQFMVFAIVSVASLLLARDKLANWFRGGTKDKGGDSNFQSEIGERGTAIQDFANGAGRIRLNGVEWSAFCDEPLSEGETVWVVSNNGIQLTVSPKKPEKQALKEQSN
ncbi:MAG: NfeD family protein [Pseudohongiellaceae bacterium]|nr:NfeD family protein [Pseudohongiellaceae bacterium]